MLHFVLGRVRSGKTSYIIDKIESRREEGTLFLVPEQHSHSMERRLCERCGNSVSRFAEVTSFRRLAARVKSETGGAAAETVSGGRRLLLLRRAVRAVASELCVLGKIASRPDRLPEVLSAIDELKAYGISPEALAKAEGEVTEGCGKKMKDISLIYAAYEAELGEDEFDAYDELAFIAESLRESDFWHDKTLCLDGFSGFTAAEFDIIGSAISKARDVYIALPIAKSFEEGAENGIFDKAAETKKRIIELAKRSGTEYDEVCLCREVSSALYHLDGAVFSDEIKRFDAPAPEICICRADGAFEECEKAAAYILDRVREGARYRDFSIAVTETEEYLAVCESVLSRYGIPVYVSKESPLTSKPPVALILSALDCALRGFKAGSVMEYLKTGFSGVCAKSLDIFENYMYTWSPKASEWAQGKDFARNPFGISAQETDESREMLRVINCVRKKLYEPIERLRKALIKGRTGEKCAEALYDFINDINLPRRIGAYSYLAECGGRFADAQEYESLMNILCGAIDSIGHAVGEDEISIEELYLLFKMVVSQSSLATIPASLDCVGVSDLSRADGEKCAYRIILGAQEGAFPNGADSAGLLSDSDRAELSDCGIELAPGMGERIFEEYRTIHSVLCSGERGLYISSSALGANGEEKQESSIVARIRSIYGGLSEGLSVHDARLRAKVPCFDESVAGRRMYALWEQDPKYARKLSAARHNAKGERGPITQRENIEAVFGKKIALSASRADLFSSCRYAYFLKYGLKAQERLRAELSPIEAGSLMHYVLERVISERSRSGELDAERAVSLAEAACREYAEQALRGADRLSGRDEFLIRRLEKTVKSAVEDICRELSKSEFKPREFELKFDGGEDALPPIEIQGESATVLLRGAVDRVDTCELDGKLYFRVIDYKSGKKEFSLDEAINGVGMQMLLYMFALEETGKLRFGREAHAAGVMYVPIARELPRGRGEKKGETRREGVILRDMRVIDAMESGEEKQYIPVSVDKKGAIKKGSVVLSAREFAAVKDKMRQILARIGDELNRGRIEPNPYVHKGSSSCDFCAYKSVCAFDEARCGDKKRELVQTKLRDMFEEMGGEEDERCEVDS